MVDTPHPRLSTGIEPSGVKLSSTFPPFPAKLVTKVQGGQYVDMKELLTDNIALQSQLDALRTANQQFSYQQQSAPALWRWDLH